MKRHLQYLISFLPALLMITTFSSYAQSNQEFTFELKTTTANVIASRALIDVPVLTGISAAIIVATPVGNTKTLNPQPTGAWYYNGKWNLFNTNHAALPIGLTYKLTYFLKSDANQFLHTVTQQNLGANGSYINHPALDNNPNALFAFFQNHAPGVRTAGLNAFEEKVVYNTAAKKWYISNIGAQPLTLNAVYNIVIVLPTLVTTILINGAILPNPSNNPTTQPCNCPTSLPPSGLAGGDLVGPYPDPMVRKILGRFLSNKPPNPGQILKWNGNEWAPANDNEGVGGTNNPETWKNNGAHISNINTGNVGIGNNNPAYPLDISNRIRIRSGGSNTVSAGLWLNNNANTEAAFIGMEDDAHVGFFGKSTGWKFSMNTQTGALKINGTEGTAGQVLTSNGVGSPPTWTQPSGGTTTGAPMQTFFKSEYETSPSLGMSGSYTFAKHTYLITVTKNSRLIISGDFNLYASACIACSGTVMSLSLYINNVFVTGIKGGVAANNSNSPMSFCNYMLDLAPGQHLIDFRAHHPWVDGNTQGSLDVKYTSIIVIDK